MTTAAELLQMIEADTASQAPQQGGAPTAADLLGQISQDTGFVPIGTLPGDFPGEQVPQQQSMAPMQQQAPDSFTSGDIAKGTLETLGTIISGGTTGVVGYTGNLLRQILQEAQSGQFGTPEAAQRIARSAMEGMAMGTYAPRTQAGQEIAQGLGEIAAPLAALPPAAAGFSGPLRASTQAVSPIAGAGVRALATGDFDALLQNAAQAMRPVINNSSNSFGTLSVGAAEVPDALRRIYRAQELDVPINISLGQATRQQPLMQFEQQQAGIGTRGAPIRELWDDQRLKLQQNFDSMIDRSGAINFSALEASESVFKALANKLESDRKNVRQLYNTARASGGMRDNVNIDDFADYMNANRAQRRENSIMTMVQNQMDAMEISDGSFANNDLSIGKMNLNQAEQLRRFINQNTDWNDRREARIAGEMKGIIDDATEGLGNEDYKKARAARRKMAQDFEDFDLLNKIVSTKRNSTERALAVENFLEKNVLSKSASTQSIRQLKKVLQSAGEDGEQAWRDIKAATAGWLKNKMLSNTTDEKGVEYVKPYGLQKAVNQLDNAGKLDLIFGYEDANKIRTINEVAQFVSTAPQNVVNSSATAIMLAGLVDAAVMFNTGLPLPVISFLRYVGNSAEDKKLQRKIQKHLEPLATLEDQ